MRRLVLCGLLLAVCCAAPVLAAPASPDRDAQTSTIGGARIAIGESKALTEKPEAEGESLPATPTEADGSEPPLTYSPPTQEAEARPGIDRDEALETPAAIAAREQTQYAYTDLAPEQTTELLRESFATQLEQLDADPSRALSEVSLQSVLSPTEAVVELEGERALLESTVPFRVPDEDGTMAKVDLGLEQTESGFEPKNSLAEVSLPSSAAGSIEVGEIGLKLAPSADQGSDITISSARPFGKEDLILPDVAEDTSLLLSPITGGAELSVLVASRRGPERLRFIVEMPDQARLRPTTDGGAEVITGEGKEQLARIAAPFAVDAEGTAVPVTLVTEENAIVLSFPHRSMDIAYPLFIDPEIEENWWGFADTSKLGFWQWQWSGVGPEDFIGQRSCIVSCWGNGLYVRARSNFKYPAGSFGRWWFVPQGSTTFMRRVIFGPMNLDGHECIANEPHGFVGVWNDGGFWSVLAPSTPSGVVNWVDTGEQNLGAGARTAFVGLDAAGQVQLKCGRDYAMGGAVLYLNDPEDPSVNASGFPTGWVRDNSPFTIDVPVGDPGLGVKSATISPADSPPLSTKELGCTGHFDSSCPANHTFQFTVSADSFSEGEKEVRISARDALGKNSNTFPFMMKVDSKPPDVTLGGQLAIATKEAEGESKDPTDFDPLSLPVYNLAIDARDGVENGSPGQRRSGVKSIEVFLDNSNTPKQTWTQPPCSNSCGMKQTFTLKLNELEALTHHTLTVVVKDHAGNAPREREIEFEYVPATGMQEEDVLHYFPLPNGQGDEDSEEDPIRPELAVNVMNGNLVYRQRDIDVLGPGADLELERFYNSLLPSSEDTEWGDGWTLAQTPTLEAQGSTLAAAGEATLLDESGAVESQVNLPEQIGEERFDAQLQATIGRGPDGYEVTDESGEDEGTVVFNDAGEATELETGEYARIDYDYDEGGLAEIAVDDVASVSLKPGEAAQREILEGIAPAYKSTFGAHGTANGQFGVLNDVAIDPTDGTVWASDDENDRIQHFTASGEFLGKFVSCQDPGAVEINSSGEVIVACSQFNLIRRYSDTGTLLKTIATSGSGDGQTNYPLDLDIDAKGNLWVADAENNRVIEFDASGAFVDDFGAGVLSRPKGIAIGQGGSIWVAEASQHRITVLEPDGDLLRRFGTEGGREGQFAHPSDVEVDTHGYAWVADAVNDRVQIFNRRGEYVTEFGASGTGPGEFNSDWWLRLAIDGEGNVWVADEGNSRVERWQAHGRLLAQHGFTLQDDPSVEVDIDDGLVERVEGKEAGEIAYDHDDQLLTAVVAPEGETSYDYDDGRMTKVTLPNGTFAEIAYEPTFGRVSSVTVSVAGGPPSTTHFNYQDQPQRKTTVTAPGVPVTTYEFAADGSMLRWSNAKKPPVLDDVGGTLHDVETRETSSPIAPGLYNLTVQAFSPEGIASIQVVANNSVLVSEKSCAQTPGPPVECEKESDEWVMETGAFPPGILYLEVIATDSLGESSAERFWVNVPYTPPPDPEADAPPRFADILKFREEYGLDLDLNGDEEAINDRVFNLIGDWHNPNTPAGELARATEERWSVPLRPVDAAEMEFRHAYIGHDAPAVRAWGEAHHPGTFAGYYVDHQAGGTVHIGFTQEQAQRVAEIKQQVQLLAPGNRVEAFPASAPPIQPLSSLDSALEAVESAIETNATVQALVSEVGIDESANKLSIGATDVAQASGVIAGIVGAQIPLDVHPAEEWSSASGRFRTTGRMRAGDKILSANAGCTAGFGAYEERNRKDNGKSITARFLLTAGHCFPVGTSVFRSDRTDFEDSDDWAPVGQVTRKALRGTFGSDGLAIRSDVPGLMPHGIFGTNGKLVATGPAAAIGTEDTLCYSGSTLQGVSCGPVLGSITGELHGTTFHAYTVKFHRPVREGDSGGPVWNPATGASVGLVSAYLVKRPNISVVAPLLHPPGTSVKRAPGILHDPEMFSLHLITGD